MKFSSLKNRYQATKEIALVYDNLLIFWYLFREAQLEAVHANVKSRTIFKAVKAIDFHTRSVI